MFFIPGWLISLFTMPGVIVHEWAHKKFCEWLKVPVYKIVYFRFGNPAGYVEHAVPRFYSQIFWISCGPLILNTSFAIFFGFLSSRPREESFFVIFLLWLAISIGMHAFPSDHDMKHILEASKIELKRGGSLFYLLAFPFVGLVWLANKLRFIWFDFWYALFLVFLGSNFL